jgi:hypothetical protein
MPESYWYEVGTDSLGRKRRLLTGEEHGGEGAVSTAGQKTPVADRRGAWGWEGSLDG